MQSEQHSDQVDEQQRKQSEAGEVDGYGGVFHVTGVFTTVMVPPMLPPLPKGGGLGATGDGGAAGGGGGETIDGRDWFQLD